MIKNKIILFAIAILTSVNIYADGISKEDTDSLRIVDIEEVVVIATPKENKKLRELPSSVSLLSSKEMSYNKVHTVKGLTSVVPNLYIPDYGSKMSTAIYIRGIGSRVNTPSVGMYVDNVPYIEKSAFDFNYDDIERIVVMRGPQGTLYGRNTMGGLIKVYTKSPFTYQGTDLKVGVATYGDYNFSAKHYHRMNEKMAFSFGGFYNRSAGYFRNASKDNGKIDKGDSAGARFRGIYRPNNRLDIDLTVNAEYDNHGAFPYIYEGTVDKKKERRQDKIGQISFNSDSKYTRGLINTGLNIEYRAKEFIFSSVTGFQALKDRMDIDQDFTEEDIYTLTQKQNSKSISQEFVIKAKAGKKWQWAMGAFGYHQWLNIDAPVSIKKIGLDRMIANNMNRGFAMLSQMNPSMPKMSIQIKNKELGIPGEFNNPTLNTAIYHQSTINDLFVKGLSVTAGVRLDYEQIKMNYNTFTEPFVFDFNISVRGRDIKLADLRGGSKFNGDMKDSYLQILPKVSVQYEWKKGNSVYATMTKGYRSGGFNHQMFSDLFNAELSNSVMTTLQEGMRRNPMFAPMAERLDNYKQQGQKPEDVAIYRPEYTWSYEVGTHLSLFDERVTADISAFYMATKDQQVSHFAQHGFGRTVTNAGKSHSYGAEVALKAFVAEDLLASISYGHTQAKFTEHVIYQQSRNGQKQVKDDFSGNYVPFIPRNTLNAGLQYTIQTTNSSWLKDITLHTNYQAAGSIYWTEANNVSQKYYGTLNARAELNAGKAKLSVWGQNLTSSKHSVFYFESFGNKFSQQARPLTVGMDITVTL